MLYGRSPSSEHPLPLSLPDILSAIKSFKSGFTIGEGKNIAGYIHVRDLARMYFLLLASALNPKPAQTSALPHDIWGPQAYYFATAEDLSFKDYMTMIVKVLHGLGVVETTDLQQINTSGAVKDDGSLVGVPPPDFWAPYIPIMFGFNMRARSTRARALGWQPVAPKVEETLEDVLKASL